MSKTYHLSFTSTPDALDPEPNELRNHLKARFNKPLTVDRKLVIDVLHWLVGAQAILGVITFAGLFGGPTIAPIITFFTVLATLLLQCLLAAMHAREGGWSYIQKIKINNDGLYLTTSEEHSGSSIVSITRIEDIPTGLDKAIRILDRHDIARARRVKGALKALGVKPQKNLLLPDSQHSNRGLLSVAENPLKEKLKEKSSVVI